MEKVDNVPIFFIVGRPRSGTTLLRTLFDAHPDVCIPVECKFIIDLYPKYGKITLWTKSLLKDFFLDLLEQWRFDIWKTDNEKLLTDLLECAGENTYANICKVVYLNYPSFFNKNEIKIFGDKNPGYTIYTERLLKIFPDAKFIHITRDYRDNYISITNVDFEMPIISMTVAKWVNFINKFNRAAKRHPGKYTNIRFEDLVNDPVNQFKRLCQFVGIEYSEEVFDFYKKKKEVIELYSEAFINKYQSSLLEKVNPKKAGIWKTQLADNKVRMADYVAGKTAALAGYERKYSSFGLGTRLKALPGITLGLIFRMGMVVVDWMPYKVRAFVMNKGPIILAGIFLRIFKPAKYREMQAMRG